VVVVDDVEVVVEEVEDVVLLVVVVVDDVVVVAPPKRSPMDVRACGAEPETTEEMGLPAASSMTVTVAREMTKTRPIKAINGHVLRRRP
jgi:hypothetical protein